MAGSGVGVVVLRRLEDALTAGDPIYAVIKGSAINNDGSAKVGYTAPSVEGQVAVIAAAQAAGGLAPETVSMIEAHGTGTVLGDPIELTALEQVLGGSGGRGFCSVGSVKSNLGHLDAAAGVAGLIKAALSLHHEEIPASLHCETPTPQIDWSSSPLYVARERVAWPRGERVRRAGVSSFGIGGTNAHVVLEEAPVRPASARRREWVVLPVSARTPQALEAASSRLAAHLSAHPEEDLGSVGYTLQVGRRGFRCRRAVVARTLEEARSRLVSGGWEERLEEEGEERPVAFLLPGQGAQAVEMGRGLYETEPGFRSRIDAWSERLRPRLGGDLREVLYPRPEQRERARELLGQTQWTQPALFVAELALAQLWGDWGVEPESLLGHSLGEYVAACLAGVLTVEEGLDLVAERGRLIGELPPGGMLAVSLPELEVMGWLEDGLSVAAVNTPDRTVVSGPLDRLARLAERLEREGIAARHLWTSHAFHSAMLEPVLERFAAAVARVDLQRPRIPYVSNLTGRWITAEEATDPEYWVRQLREPVRFAAGAAELLRESRRLLLEVGPGRQLGSLAQRAVEGAGRRAIASLPEPGTAGEVEHLLTAVGRLWAAGGRIDWQRFQQGERLQRLHLPTYPFERQRYFLDALAASTATASTERRDLERWLYAPSWKRAVSPLGGRKEELRAVRRRWLVFAGRDALSAAVLACLDIAAQELTVVWEAGHSTPLGPHEHVVTPSSQEDYDSLFDRTGPAPDIVLDLWSLSPVPESTNGEPADFYRLLFLGQALSRLNPERPVQLAVVASGVHAIDGDEELSPMRATLLGPCRSIPLEVPQVSCSCIDVRSADSLAADPGRLAERLLVDLVTGPATPVAAYRGRHRWVQVFEPVHVAAPQAGDGLRQGGVYLITGGLGGVGFELARFLSTQVGARLVLTGRSAPPADWLSAPTGEALEPRLREQVRRARELVENGAEVMWMGVDVTDREGMRVCVAAAEERFGRLHGVIHAAGIPSGGLLQLKSAAQAAAVLAPKVRGTQMLAEVLADRDLDFFVFCSSLAAIAPNPFNIDYCAANSYLDAFAWERAQRGLPALAINWDTWRETGMAYEVEGEQGRAEMARGGIGMATWEAVEIFRRALASGLPQVLVSTVDLEAVQQRRPSLADLAPAVDAAAPARPRHVRPGLSAPYIAAAGAIEQSLAEIWGDLLGVEPIGALDDFFELGGDSVVAIQVIARARRAGLRVTPRQVFEHRTVRSLAAVVGTGEMAAAEQGEVTGEVPLTPIQEWFFAQGFETPDHWNQALLLKVAKPLEAGKLAGALTQVMAQHDALRARFTPGAGTWQQDILPSRPTEPLVVDLDGLERERRAGAFAAAVAAAQASLDLVLGRLVCAVYFPRFAAGSGRLLLVVHHLVVDAVSWRPLLEDLETAYGQLDRGEPVALPPKTASWRSWARSLAAHATSPAVEEELPYWLAEPRFRVPPLPVDRDAEERGIGRSVTVTLPAAETRMLVQEAAQAYRARLDEILLAALAMSFARMSGARLLLVDVEGHGRGAELADLDLSRTVGWFTTMAPLLLNLEVAGGDPVEVLAAVKQQVRAVPHGGSGYGLLRYLNPATREQLAALPAAEMSFLYLGQLDQAVASSALFALASEPSGPAQGPRERRTHRLSFTGAVIEDQLQWTIIYGEESYDRATIELLAAELLASLRALDERCRRGEAAAVTPADFEYVSLSQEELDSLVDSFDRTPGEA